MPCVLESNVKNYKSLFSQNLNKQVLFGRGWGEREDGVLPVLLRHW